MIEHFVYQYGCVVSVRNFQEYFVNKDSVVQQ